jgi:RNA polymerase sigma-70 factor (ECF subfamily)
MTLESDMVFEPGTQRQPFPPTHWTVVLAARDQREGTSAREALANMCSTYWYPLYGYIRRQGFNPPDAEDLTQEFFYHFLEGDWLKHVAPARGRFRSFLLGCLKHFLAKERERGHAARRAGGRKLISLESAAARYSLEPLDDLSPEVVFEQRWATTVLASALEDLRQEYAACGKSDCFEELMGFLPGCQNTLSRAELADRRRVSVEAIDVAIHRLRQRYGALLRQRVAQTISGDGDLDDELRYLMSVVGNAS